MRAQKVKNDNFVCFHEGIASPETSLAFFHGFLLIFYKIWSPANQLEQKRIYSAAL